LSPETEITEIFLYSWRALYANVPDTHIQREDKSKRYQGRLTKRVTFLAAASLRRRQVCLLPISVPVVA